MTDLAQHHCEACRIDAPRVSADEATALLMELEGWKIIPTDGISQLHKAYDFPDFVTALAFTNRVGEIAEAEGHHPDLLTTWGKVTVSWWSHKIRGLHKNDFIMAAKTDGVYQNP